jgi:FixJ family two-component response regulator
VTEILNDALPVDAVAGGDPSAVGGAAVVRYEDLAERFRPVFERIAEGAAEREAARTLPFEQVG